MIDDGPNRPRPVARYVGAQIMDAREKIVVRFSDTPKRGVRMLLNYHRFEKQRDGSFARNASPQAIFAAQAVLNEFYEEQK